MPKSKEYLSSSESDASSNDEPKPKKKKKTESKPEKTESKSSSSKSESKVKKGPGGEYMFQLARMRFATVGEFRGKVMVGIREYYETDSGEIRPGKKGISLSAEQWEALKDNISEIDEAVKKF